MPNDFNQPVIDEFRANRGQVGGYFEGARLLLLTTTGARTGTPHTTPLGYLPDGGERVLVIASAAGSSRHPDWYRNILAHPQVTVESGVFTYEARAVVLDREERDRIFARAVEAEPGWATYQEKTDRIIPVVALYEIAQDGPPRINASGMGEAIKVVHDAFRRELALIRKEMSEATSNTAPLGAQLRANCLTFCAGLHNHHTGEDIGLFPFLADRHPRPPPWNACAPSTSGSPPSSSNCAGLSPARARARTPTPPPSGRRSSVSPSNSKPISPTRKSS